MSTDATLTEFARFAGILGHERAGQREADDIAQESLIAVWQTLAARPDAPQSYLIGAAKNGANAAACGRKLFGAPSRQGRREAHEGAASFELAREFGYDIPTEDRDTLHERDTVRAAVRALPCPRDRELCWLRFWGGMTFAECAAQLGTPVATLTSRWSAVIAPALREALAGAL